MGFSKESKRLMSESRMGKKNPMYGKHFTEEAKRKSSESHKGINNPMYGKKHTDEARTKICIARKRQIIHPMEGRHHTGKTKYLLSESLKGEKSPCWRGGLSFLYYPQEFDGNLKNKIKQRDFNECSECFDINRLAIHHIDYDKCNNNENNLITLCCSCHGKTCNGDRKKWTNHFIWKMELNEMIKNSTI